MRILLLLSILFASLVASEARMKFEKVISTIEEHYFKPFSRQELLSKSVDGLLQNSSYIIKPEKKHIKQRFNRVDGAIKRVELLHEFLLKKGFLSDEIYMMLIDSSMSLLDTHSRYLDREQMQELRIKTEGIFVGIGITLGRVEGSLAVLSVLENSPAKKAGIRVLDTFMEIDGNSCEEISLEGAIDLLRGDIGELVNLRIKRDSRVIDLKLKRESIELETLGFKRMKNGILYFKISSFNSNIAQMISKKIKKYQNSSRSIIIDLRGNPGGLVSQAVKVADMFLNRGNIITQIGRGGSDIKSYDALKNRTLTELPLAILVDTNTASSAEILSGALQIHHRATLFGERTFGKGSVESLYAIDSEEFLSLTIAHYFLADDGSIEGVGVLPDYEVETSIIHGRDECLESAKEFLHNRESFSKKHSSQMSGVCTKKER